MTVKKFDPSKMVFRRGQEIQAEYKDTEVDWYRGHPWLEALPRIWEADEVGAMLRLPINFKEEHRSSRSAVRLHYIQNAIRFFQPIAIHIKLEQRLSRMIRAGYVDRNPMHPEFNRNVRERIETLQANLEGGIIDGQPGNNDYQIQNFSEVEVSPDENQLTDQTGTAYSGLLFAFGFVMLGASGIGKTFGISRILSFYPQIINHSHYQGRDFTHRQIVWMHLDCPYDGSRRGLCLSALHTIDRLIGTDYYRNYVGKGRPTTDELIEHLVNVFSWHGLGCLVLDELQLLAEIKRAESKGLLQFLVQLVNVIQVPVLLVGTYKARNLLASEFRQARRGTGQGDLIWDPMKFDQTWKLFLKGFWNYQYLKDPVDLTEELSQVIFEESAGITDLAVKLFLLSQYQAIEDASTKKDKEEQLTPKLIRKVAKENFQLARPALRALRAASKTKNKSVQNRLLNRYEDLLPPNWEEQLTDMLQNPQFSDEHMINMLLAQQGTEIEGSQNTSDQANSSKPEPKPQEKPVESKAEPKTVSKKTTLNGKTLVEIVAKGVEQGQAAYQSLKEAGFIKSATEFVEMCGNNGKE